MMNELTSTIVWAAFQVFVFSSIVAGAVLFVRRWFGGMVSDLVTVSMAMILGISLLSFTPIRIVLPTFESHTSTESFESAEPFSTDTIKPSNSFVENVDSKINDATGSLGPCRGDEFDCRTS